MNAGMNECYCWWCCWHVGVVAVVVSVGVGVLVADDNADNAGVVVAAIVIAIIDDAAVAADLLLLLAVVVLLVVAATVGAATVACFWMVRF